MKKFWVLFGLSCAVFFASCDGEKDFDAGNGSSNQNSSETSVCSYGTYECHGNDSYYCGYPESSNDLMWSFAEKCDNGCNEQTGKCKTDSDAGNNGGSGNNGNNNGNSSGNNDEQAIPCTRDENYYETKKCIDGHSYSCECISHDENENGEEICNKYLWIKNDICKGGCNESTGQCEKAECSIEQAEAEVYECFEDYSFKCEKDDSSHAHWEKQNFCIIGCNESTGRCPLCEEDTFMCHGDYFGDYSLVCEYDGWKIKDLCFTGCNESTGKCNPCQENTFVCYEDSTYNYSYSYKCKNSNFESYDNCGKSGCNSSSGKCRCTDFVEGYKSCDYSELRTCINGVWEIEICDYGCDSKTLSCADPCEEGAFRCNGDVSQKCDYYKIWREYENCANSNKTCNPATGKCA